MCAVIGRNGQGLAQAVGWVRSEWESAIAVAAGLSLAPTPTIDWAALPERLEGCGSKTHMLDADAESGGPLDAFSSRKVEVASADDEQEFMHAAGFTDGLPVVAPTPARVAAMLRGTLRDRQEVIVAEVPPLMGSATVEKVAINAVMAGCTPPCMPLILAALEAVCTDEFNAHGVYATTMSAAVGLIYNGPARQHAGLVCGQNALGVGGANRANLSIGRAVRLVMQNVGGVQAGFAEMATVGSPLKISLTLGEWEEHAQEWEPLHVERGYAADVPVVTALALTGMTLLMDQTSRTPEQLVGTFAATLSTAFSRRAANLADSLLLVCPEHYHTLSRAGWSKAKLRDELHRSCVVPVPELANTAEEGGSGFVNTPKALRDADAQGRSLPKMKRINETGHFGLSIVVAGGEAGKFSYYFSGWSGGRMGSIPMSEVVQL
jgi:hypothetical protein